MYYSIAGISALLLASSSPFANAALDEFSMKPDQRVHRLGVHEGTGTVDPSSALDDGAGRRRRRAVDASHLLLQDASHVGVLRDSPWDLFEAWMKAYEKTYEKTEDMMMRFTVFQENAARIAEHNAGGETFLMALNQVGVGGTSGGDGNVASGRPTDRPTARLTD